MVEPQVSLSDLPLYAELDQPVLQKKDTYQCWWLSLLEAVRISGKLTPLFLAEGGMLHGYFVDLNPALPQKWPRENELPSSVNKDNVKIKSWLSTKGIAWEVGRTRLVYGPQWQRMIMFYLLKENKWVLPDDGFFGGNRPERLTKLLEVLDVQGIAFGAAWNAIPSNVKTSLDNLTNNQLLIVDKKEKHAMLGVVRKKERKVIWVYNQATQNSFDCWPQQVDGSWKLKSANDTVLNYYLPVNIV